MVDDDDYEDDSCNEGCGYGHVNGCDYDFTILLFCFCFTQCSCFTVVNWLVIKDMLTDHYF